MCITAGSRESTRAASTAPNVLPNRMSLMHGQCINDIRLGSTLGAVDAALVLSLLPAVIHIGPRLKNLCLSQFTVSDAFLIPVVQSCLHPQQICVNYYSKWVGPLP